MLQTVKSFSDEELHFKSSDAEWSILQIMEHICITENIVCRVISKPSETINETPEILGDEKMKRKVVDKRKEAKVTAPERLLPKGNIADAAAFEKIFSEQRNLLQRDIEEGKIIIDNRVHKHLVLGDMTISDWLYFLIHHTQRHLDQIKDVQNNFNSRQH